MLGPFLAYTLYPGPPPVEETEQLPTFVEALGHCRIYGGRTVVKGVIAGFEGGMLHIRAGSNLYMIPVRGCWISGSQLLDLGELEPGTEILVEGQVYAMRQGIVIQPTLLVVNGVKYMPTQCPATRIPYPPHHCTMCPHP